MIRKEFIMNKMINELVNEVKKVIKGKDDKIIEVVMAMLASGHVLLEDNPGLGKTVLAKTLSRAMAVDQKRIQFTPDTMPTDIVGMVMMEKKFEDGREQYKKHFEGGPVFTNILLADEINRTSGKTQAALLEVMEECTVTADGKTRELPSPFMVIATQNPNTSGGTQQLPEAQLDRFIIKTSMGYPDEEGEVSMLMDDNGSNSLDRVMAVINAEEMNHMRQEVKKTYMDENVARYIVRLCAYTRNQKDKITVGISPRGAKALTKMAKAHAFISGRDYVTVEDVQQVIPSVFSHRLILTPSYRREENAIGKVLSEMLGAVVAPQVAGYRNDYNGMFDIKAV